MSSQGFPGARGPRGFPGPPGLQVRSDQMAGDCYQCRYKYKQMKRDFNFISISSGRNEPLVYQYYSFWTLFLGSNWSSRF